MTTNATPEGTPADASAVAAPAKKSKVRRNVLLAGSAVGLVGIGSTLAANISLNGGNNVEFGQGVAKTTACDEDGFTINPVASYDTKQSIWRLDRVDVTGLNLTPAGTGFLDAGYTYQSDAKADHPGEYYENGTWKRTCDGVVLDFKAYTDNTNYWSLTRDGYSNGLTNDIASPVGWAQFHGYEGDTGEASNNFGFSVVFDTFDDGTDYDSNYGEGRDVTSQNYANAAKTNWNNLNYSTPANSSFSFGVLSTYWNGQRNTAYHPDWRPDAGSISKIAVSSMATFPTNYYLANDSGIGQG